MEKNTTWILVILIGISLLFNVLIYVSRFDESKLDKSADTYRYEVVRLNDMNYVIIDHEEDKIYLNGIRNDAYFTEEQVIR